MEDSTVRECRINFLQHEYTRYSKLIYDQMQHIEKLYREGYIQSQQRLSAFNTINNLIRFMNQDIYNVKLKELKIPNQISQDGSENIISDENNNNNNDEDNILDNTFNIFSVLPLADIFSTETNDSNINIDTLLDICKIGNIGSLTNIMPDNFSKVAEKLIKIGKDVGFKSIYHALELLIGRSHSELIKENIIENNDAESDKIKDFRDMLELINDAFIPIKFTQIDNCVENLFNIECIINEKPPNELFLLPYATLTICFPTSSTKFEFEGYFSSDPIQCLVRTCQVSKPILYKKKKQLQVYVDELRTGYINKKFANIYIKNMAAGEIISYTKEQFLSRLASDFDRYTKLSKMTFRNLMEEFTKDSQNNLKNMYMIIKLLLLGPDDCINMAGLLFGLTKDKKINSEIVADLIYNNLNLVLQSKLKKSASNIKNELDKIKSMTDEDVPIEKVVAANTKIPANIKKYIFNKLHELKTQNTENSKNKLYADTLIRFPHINDDTTFTDLNKDQKKSCEFMSNVMKTLNEKIYGHTECKNAIKELICSWILNPSKMGKAIALCGPPGVGKTLIAKGIGAALGFPVRCISLCGMEDGSVLNGHSFTYSNAQPGLLVREMCEAGKARCILFFDEVDKTSKRHGIDEIQNILINLTDPNMNDKFNDKFIQDVHFNFSSTLIICTYNNKSALDPILLNRLHEIDVKPYTMKDKLKICKDFLLKEITTDINLEYNSITISDTNIKHIIENYTYESGVRELKRMIETLFLKLNVDRLYRKGMFTCECKKLSNEICSCDQCGSCDKCKDCVKCNIVCNKDCKLEITKSNPVMISHEIITKYLLRPKIHYDKIHPYPLIGGVNGLYATTLGGGGLVTIIVQKNLTGSGNNFELKLTGSQGKVMKESVQFAWDTITNLLKEEYVTEFINKHKLGVSVHALDGATNKDGPSAGCAFGTAFISLVLEKHIKNTIAMTGEIGIHGECKEIGGLVSKLYGAKKAGVKLVCIPESNDKDLEELEKQDPELFDDSFKVKKCKYIHDILPNVFEDGFDIVKYLKPRPEITDNTDKK